MMTLQASSSATYVSAHHTMFKLACLVGTLAAGSVEAFAPLRPVARPFSRTHGRVWLSPEEAEKVMKRPCYSHSIHHVPRV